MVEFNGKPVSSVKTAFKSAARLAGLGPGISPHTLRHTAATWLMQKGADPWQAAGYLGISLEVLLNTCGRHHPDYLSDAVEKIAMRKARDLKSRKVQKLGELVIAAGADSLSADELVGALIMLAETKDTGRKETWAKRGAAFFQSRVRRTAPAAERHTGGARAQPGGAQPSTGSKGAA